MTGPTAEELNDLFAQFCVDAETTINAPPEAVWALVADVTRIGEFSPECVGAEWVDGSSAPSVGATFAGTNHKGERDWTRPCTVTASDPHRFAYVVGDQFDGSPAGDWSFDIETTNEGSVLRQRFQHRPAGRSGIRTLADEGQDASALIAWRRTDLQQAMNATLAAMKVALEGNT